MRIIKALPHVACGGAVLAGDADVPVIHVDGELQCTGGVGDRVHGGVPQHGRDSVRGVAGLAPARDLHVQVVPGAVPLRVRGQADGPDVVWCQNYIVKSYSILVFTLTIELDGLWKVDQSNVVMDEEGIVALVVDNVSAHDLHPAIFGVLPHVVCP